MLGLEAYGEVRVQPHGQALVIEKQGRYDSAPAYPYGYFSRRLTSHIFVRPLDRDVALRPLFDQDRDAGYWAGGFSPSGRSLIIFRLDVRRLQVGVLDMASHVVRWLPDHPDLPLASPDPIWIDDNHILLATTGNDSLPFLLDFSSKTQRDLPTLWNRATEGRVASVTAIGSGTELGVRDRRTPGALRLIDIRTGIEKSLIAGDVVDVALSSDHRMVAVVTTTSDVQPDPAGLINASTSSQRHRLDLIDLANDQSSTPCSDCDVIGQTLAFSSTGHQLLFYGRLARQSWQDGQVYLAKGASNCRPLLPASIGATIVGVAGGDSVRLGWAGATPFLLAHRSGDTRDDWYALGRSPSRLTAALAEAPSRLLTAGRDGLLLLSGSAILRVRLDGSITRPRIAAVSAVGTLSKDGLRRGARHILADPATVVSLVGRNKSVSIHAVRDQRVSPLGIDDEPGATLLAVDPAGRWIVSSLVDAHGVGRLRLVRRTGAVTIDTINPGLAAVDPALPRPLRSHDGNQQVTHWLYLPPQLPSGAKAPLLVVPYPGTLFDGDTPPPEDLDAVWAVLNVQLLAGQGYAVLFPSMPRADTDHDPLSRITPEVDSAVDAAIAGGRVDPDRIAVWGHSFGGYAALAIAGHSMRYRAIIASSALADLISNYGALVAATKTRLDNGLLSSATFGWSEAGQGNLAATPWQDPQRYIRNSPFFDVQRMRTPIMLIQGDIDYVGIAQSEQMFAALYRLDKDAILLRYWGEDHLPESPANIRDLYARVFAFLSQKLAPSLPRAAAVMTSPAPKLPG